jgi:hypothetical protein
VSTTARSRLRKIAAQQDADTLIDLVESLTADRDKWIRAFNRLEAAISHHKRDNDFADLEDEALWHARDKILRDVAERPA